MTSYRKKGEKGEKEEFSELRRQIQQPKSSELSNIIERNRIPLGELQRLLRSSGVISIFSRESSRRSKKRFSFSRSTKNKIHSPPSHGEPSLKQREDLDILLFCNRNCSVVIFHPLKEILL